MITTQTREMCFPSDGFMIASVPLTEFKLSALSPIMIDVDHDCPDNY